MNYITNNVMSEKLAPDLLDISHIVSKLKSEIEAHGIWFTEGSDVKALEAEIETTDKELTVLLSRRGNLYQPGDIFYILGRESDTHSPVCLVAGRRDRFSGWSMRRYLEEYVPKVMTFSDREPAKLSDRQPGFWNMAPQNPAYLCELWTAKCFRNKGIAQNMVKLAQMYAFLKWQPDLIWALMSDDDVSGKGLALKYGWTQVVEDALWWDLPPREIPEKVWYVGTTPVGLSDLVERHLRAARSLQQQKTAPNIHDLAVPAG